MPNLTGPVVIYATLTIPEIIITESFLSYLGLGVQEPQTSLGTLISSGAPVAEGAALDADRPRRGAGRRCCFASPISGTGCATRSTPRIADDETRSPSKTST